MTADEGSIFFLLLIGIKISEVNKKLSIYFKFIQKRYRNARIKIKSNTKAVEYRGTAAIYNGTGFMKKIKLK